MDSSGIIYLTTYDGHLYAIDSGTNAGPADSAWPMKAYNQYNNSRVGTEEGPLSVEAEAPMDFALLGNYPNPFNPSTTIEFSLKTTDSVNLTIYNMAGQRIRELIPDTNVTPGIHSVLWDGHDDNGQPVSAGVYISRLKAGDRTAARSILLVK